MSSLVSENTSYLKLGAFTKLESEKTFTNENSNVSTVVPKIQVNFIKKEAAETAFQSQTEIEILNLKIQPKALCETNKKTMQQTQKKGKKDLVYLLGLSDTTSLVGQTVQLKQTQATKTNQTTNSNTQIIEYEYDQKDQETEPLDDIWADKFFKKNMTSQEKFQNRLRSANPIKRDKNNILPRQEFVNQADEEKLQEMFVKTQDQFDLDSAVKLLSGVAAENYLKSNKQIFGQNSSNEQQKNVKTLITNTND